MPPEAQPFETVVLMPIFNAERFLAAAIRSALNQSYRDFELFLIDDGSTDASLRICHEFAALDSRVRVFSAPNVGLVRVLNRHLGSVRHRFLARLDADDLMTPHRLRDQVRFLRRHRGCTVVGSRTDAISLSGDFLSTYVQPCSPIAVRFFAGHGMPFAGPSLVARTKRLRRAGLLRSRAYPAEDYDLLTRLLLDGHRLTSLPQTLYHYRQTSGISATNAAEQRLKTAQIANAYRDRLLTLDYDYASPDILSDFLTDAATLPDRGGELEAEYCRIVTMYLADHWAAEPTAARRQLRRIWQGVRDQAPWLSRPLWDRVNAAVVRGEPYGFDPALSLRVPPRRTGRITLVPPPRQEAPWLRVLGHITTPYVAITEPGAGRPPTQRELRRQLHIMLDRGLDLMPVTVNRERLGLLARTQQLRFAGGSAGGLDDWIASAARSGKVV